jgi:hypothetical protein
MDNFFIDESIKMKDKSKKIKAIVCKVFRILTFAFVFCFPASDKLLYFYFQLFLKPICEILQYNPWFYFPVNIYH